MLSTSPDDIGLPQMLKVCSWTQLFLSPLFILTVVQENIFRCSWLGSTQVLLWLLAVQAVASFMASGTINGQLVSLSPGENTIQDCSFFYGFSTRKDGAGQLVLYIPELNTFLCKQPTQSGYFLQKQCSVKVMGNSRQSSPELGLILSSLASAEKQSPWL